MPSERHIGRLEPDEPTVVRRRSARPRARESERPAPSSANTPADATPEDRTIAEIVFAAEGRRAHTFSAVAMFMVALVAAQFPWLAGDAAAKRVAMLSLAAMFLVSLWAYRRTGRAGGYTTAVFRVQGWTLATGMLGVEYFVGFYSPITVVLSLGIYYLGQSTDRLHALLLPLYVVFGWTAGAVAIAVGAIDDVGFYSSAELTGEAKFFMLSGVGGTMLAALWLASVARSSVHRAIHESNRALAVARAREAQLAEAHNQLDRAMRAAVGKPGQHSGKLAGDYRLGLVIGVGGMGEVYEASHVASGRPAAVKLLHADTLAREDMVARFLREAEVCRRFEHPSLVAVYDIGRTAEGAPYLAMELLRGASLASLLRERGPADLAQVTALAQAVCAGLAHAHGHGVVHRDLKPHNIFRHRGADDDDARWKLLDFGISKPSDSTGTLTREALVGTPAYMSPEQALGQPVDHRSDLFALSSVLYRALTGGPAFPGTDTPRVMFDVAYRMPQRPSQQRDGLPADLELVLAIGLAKAPGDRFASADALADAVRLAARSRLPDPLRARARALLAAHPWGARTTQTHAST